MTGAGKSGELSGRWRYAPAVVLALLAVATVAAFGYTQRLKREPLVIDRTTILAHGATPGSRGKNVFTPNGDCRRDRVYITFRTTRTDTGDVSIVRFGGWRIRWLVRGKLLGRYVLHRMVWDGRRDDGRIANPGPYMVRVRMLNEDRTLYLPGRILVHGAPAGKSYCPEVPAKKRPGS